MNYYRVAWDRPIDVAGARALAAQMLEYACDGSRGRPEEGDAVYDAVTERRDSGAAYSSCADLAHWMLFRLGVREHFINRAEHRGFKIGKSLSRLAWCSFARDASATDRYEPGDILVIWSRPDTRDAHVTVVLRDGRLEAEPRDELETANYGAPGGAIRTSVVKYSSFAGSKVAVLGARTIRRWWHLGDVLSQLQRDGSLVGAQDPTRTEDGTVIWSPNHG